MEKIVKNTTAQDQRDWEISKTIAEIQHLKEPYFKKPASWITLLVAVMGVIGTVGQWINYRTNLREAEIKTLQANVQYQQYLLKSSELDSKISEAEDKLEDLNVQEANLIEEMAKQRDEIIFLTEQREGIRTEIASLKTQFANVEKSVAAKDPAQISSSLDKAKQALESADKESARDYKSNNPSPELIEKVLGPPPELEDLVYYELPFEMYLSWDKSRKIKGFKVHPEAIPYFESAFKKIKSRGLELLANSFGGVYNKRKIRGSDQYSVHTWGIAIDINPERNKFNWGPERWGMDERVAEAFEEAGFFWMGRLGYEAGHFSLSTKTLKEIAKKKGLSILNESANRDRTPHH